VQGSPTDLAWLAGLLDGEGWIGIFKRRRSPTKDYPRYSAAFSVTTTSARITGRVREIVESFGVNYNLREFDPYTGEDGSPRRRKWRIQTQTNVSTEPILRAVLPYLVEKKRCAELVLRYIDWRSSIPHKTGKGSNNVVAGMGDIAEEIMKLLSEDRHRHDPSTTTRLAPDSNRGDDIV
jgi:intein/homing endonuclease